MKNLLFVLLFSTSFFCHSQKVDNELSKHDRFVQLKFAEIKEHRARRIQKIKLRQAKIARLGIGKIVKLGFQTHIGVNDRILVATNDYSSNKVKERNKHQSTLYAFNIELVSHISNQKIKWMEYIIGAGYQYSCTYGKYGIEESHFGSINQGLNFIIGKKANKAIISIGSYFTLTNNPTRVQNYSSFREKYTNLNISPYFSIGFLRESIKSNNVSVQLFFKCQVKNHIEGNVYYESLPQTNPFLEEHNEPNYTTHLPENEYQWQTGIKIAYLFNLSK